MAYAGRAVTDHSNGKYRFPTGFRKSLILYNLHRITSRSIIVLEGFFDVFRLHQLGCPNTVALTILAKAFRGELVRRPIN